MEETALVPRKQGKQGRARQTINYIMQATTKLINESKSLTTNHIAKLAGISIGSLYQYFPNKNSIFKNLIDREIKRGHDKYRKEIDDIKASNLQPEEVVDRFIDVIVGDLLENEKLYAFFMTRAFEFDLVDKCVKVEDSEIELLYELLTHFKEKFGFKDEEVGDLRLKAYVVFHACFGVIRSAWIRKEVPERELLLIEVKAVAKRYLLPENY